MDFSELLMYVVRKYPNGFKPNSIELIGRMVAEEIDGKLREYSLPEAFAMLVQMKYIKESFRNKRLVKLAPTAKAFDVIAKAMLAALDRRMKLAIEDYSAALSKSKPKSRKRLKPFVAKLIENNERQHEFSEAVKTFFG